MKKDFNTLIELVNKLSIITDIEVQEKIAITEIPKLGELRNTGCNHPAHKYNNILHHSLIALMFVDKIISTDDNYTPYDISILKLVLLLHDLGKITTKEIDDTGVSHFYNHPLESVKMTEEILNDYNTDEQIKRTILNLIRYHDTFINDDELEQIIKEIGLKEMGMLLKVKRADLNAHADYYAVKKNPLLDRLDEIYHKLCNSKYLK